MSRFAVTRWRQCRLARWWRGMRPDRNPLRRRSDRLEAGVLLGLLVAFLVTAPIAAIVVSRVVEHAGRQTQLSERAARTPAVARLLTDAGPVSAGPAWAWQVRTAAAWRTRDGRSGTGTVLAAPGARAGATVTVWVNRAGRLVAAPMPGAEVSWLAAGAGVAVAAVVGAMLVAAAVVARRALLRRRLAGWDVAWDLAARG